MAQPRSAVLDAGAPSSDWNRQGNCHSCISYSGSDGQNPTAALLQARDGGFYGTAGGEGAYRNGTVFRLDPSGSFAVVSHDFWATGLDPPARSFNQRTGSSTGRPTAVEDSIGAPFSAWTPLEPPRRSGPSVFRKAPNPGRPCARHKWETLPNHSGGDAFGVGTVFRLDHDGRLAVYCTVLVESQNVASPRRRLIRPDWSRHPTEIFTERRPAGGSSALEPSSAWTRREP